LEYVTLSIKKPGKENMDHHEKNNINCGVMKSYQNLWIKGRKKLNCNGYWIEATLIYIMGKGIM